MLFSAKIFNEILPIDVISDVRTDSNFLTYVLPQLQYRQLNLDKKYKIANLVDLQNKPEYMEVLSILSKAKPVKNIYYLPFGSMLFSALTEYFGGTGKAISALPCSTLVDNAGSFKAKGVMFVLSGNLSKSTVDSDILHGDGSGNSIREFINVINSGSEAESKIA